MSSESPDEPKTPANSPMAAADADETQKIKEMLAEKTEQYNQQSQNLEKLQAQHQTLTQKYHQELGKLNQNITRLHTRMAEDDDHISNLLSQLQGQQRQIARLEDNKVWCPWHWFQKLVHKPYLTGAVGVVCLAGGVRLWRLKV